MLRALLFLLWIINGCSNTLIAQNIWVDYIVGRPDIFYLDAKKAVANDWGISYQTELAGCIDCEDTRGRAEILNQKNQAYFHLIELRYGKNWLPIFNRAVAKKHNYLKAQENQEQGIWYELLENEGDSEFYSIKQQVAAEWGIAYEVVLVDVEALTKEEKEQLQQQVEQSVHYQQQLQDRLGDQWTNWIEEESRLRLLQKLTPQKGTWVDVVWGMPNSPYYKAKAAVAKRWGIPYETRLMGNQRTEPLIYQQRDLMCQNAVYFA
ncbi:MAG: hypothetical protein AB8E82_08605, partial [Aureispira sp.]